MYDARDLCLYIDGCYSEILACVHERQEGKKARHEATWGKHTRDIWFLSCTVQALERHLLALFGDQVDVPFAIDVHELGDSFSHGELYHPGDPIETGEWSPAWLAHANLGAGHYFATALAAMCDTGENHPGVHTLLPMLAATIQLRLLQLQLAGAHPHYPVAWREPGSHVLKACEPGLSIVSKTIRLALLPAAKSDKDALLLEFSNLKVHNNNLQTWNQSNRHLWRSKDEAIRQSRYSRSPLPSPPSCTNLRCSTWAALFEYAAAPDL
jgi:hypothetical protein